MVKKTTSLALMLMFQPSPHNCTMTPRISHATIFTVQSFEYIHKSPSHAPNLRYSIRES